MTVEAPYSVLTEVKLRWLGEFFTIGHFHWWVYISWADIHVARALGTFNKACLQLFQEFLFFGKFENLLIKESFKEKCVLTEFCIWFILNSNLIPGRVKNVFRDDIRLLFNLFNRVASSVYLFIGLRLFHLLINNLSRFLNNRDILYLNLLNLFLWSNDHLFYRWLFLRDLCNFCTGSPY